MSDRQRDEFAKLTEAEQTKIAARLIETALAATGRINLSVIGGSRQSLPFVAQWGRKNIHGISFDPDDSTRAVAWARAAMQAGYLVRYSRFKSDSSGQYGPDLVDGKYQLKEDDDAISK